MNTTTIEVTDDNFEALVLQASLPVLVDYWAPWCAPCKMIAPILEVIASEYEDRLIVAKIDIDEHSRTPAKFSIRGIPTLMIFNLNELIAVTTGAMSKSQLITFIEKNI